MNEVFFLVFAFFTVFLSIRLSFYVDYLSKNSKMSGVFLAGIVLAGVTSLPEFVTCFSAILVDNPSLAIGDILGSNIFNIFMLCTFDLFFVKKCIFNNLKKSHSLVFKLLFVNYIILYLFIGKAYFLFLISIPTITILFTYMYYLFKIAKASEQGVVINDNSYSNATLKLVITAVLMVFSSVILTVIVNNLASLHPDFSSSFLGSIFLGITTSLPEVITCYYLINIGSYDLALDDIIGSNFFNLLILGIADLIFKNSLIFKTIDSDISVIISLGLCFTIFCFVNYYYNYKKYYGFLSFVVLLLYLSYWVINILG